MTTDTMKLVNGTEYELAVLGWWLRARLEEVDGKPVWLLLNQDWALPSLWVTSHSTLAYLESDDPDFETVIFMPEEILIQFPVWGLNVPTIGDLTPLQAGQDFDYEFWQEALR